MARHITTAILQIQTNATERYQEHRTERLAKPKALLANPEAARKQDKAYRARHKRNYQCAAAFCYATDPAYRAQRREPVRQATDHLTRPQACCGMAASGCKCGLWTPLATPGSCDGRICQAKERPSDPWLSPVRAAGGEHRDLARNILRRQYNDGKRIAFCYHGALAEPVHLAWVRRFLSRRVG